MKKATIAAIVVGGLICVAAVSGSQKGGGGGRGADRATEPEKAPVPPKTKAEQESDRRSSAAYACRMFVERSLHDPDSAEFDDESEYVVSKSRGGVYRVVVTLRARNGFNALRHGSVICKTRHSDALEGWEPVEIQNGE
jgi:hypothetical protein